MHKAYDKRQAGLFKIEKDHRKEMVALCSKAYVLEDHEENFKTALKGLNKVDLKDPLKKCKEVLETGKTNVGLKKGIHVHNNTLFMYEQPLAGIGNFYCERELVDNIHTKPLDLVLSPWEEDQCTVIEEDELNPEFPFQFTVEGKDFVNVYEYCQTLKSLSAENQNNLVKIIFKKRWDEDKVFRDYLSKQRDKTLVWVQEDIYWGCGLNKVLFKLTELKHMLGANQWGELLSELVCEKVYTKNFEIKS